MTKAANLAAVASATNGYANATKLQSGGVTTNALAWVNFNGTTSPGTIRSQYNVSSITKGGTGQYTINFTNALSDTNYAFSGFARASASYYLFVSSSGGSTKTTSALTVFSLRNDVGNLDDSPEVDVIVFGN